VLNAYEFERHAGCKTKHPNNHIYFENGKTIYQIVQELRSTPESMLFDVIQTVFGAPINQKSFRIWKGKGYICLTLCLLYVKNSLKT
jgi:ribonuclease I